MNRPCTLTCTPLLLLVACSAPRPESYVSLKVVEPALVGDDGRRLLAAAADALRARRFRVDRLDQRAGVVTTWPNTSQHYFELWRDDVETGWDFWEATLNPIRRRVEVHVTADPEASTVMVRAYKQRLSSPDRQFNSSGAAYQFFGENLPSTSGHTIVPERDDRWIDVGRDHALEDALLRDILARAERRDARSARADAA